MFEKHRPALGNGEKVRCEVEAEPVVEQPVSRGVEPALLRHKVGDEKRPAFWHALVTSDPQTPVARETAIFAIRVLLVQTIGYKAHRTEVAFSDDPVTVEELFGTLERLCGGSEGWQAAQKLGAY
jgi:hypothetical protein